MSMMQFHIEQVELNNAKGERSLVLVVKLHRKVGLRSNFRTCINLEDLDL